MEGMDDSNPIKSFEKKKKKVKGKRSVQKKGEEMDDPVKGGGEEEPPKNCEVEDLAEGLRKQKLSESDKEEMVKEAREMAKDYNPNYVAQHGSPPVAEIPSDINPRKFLPIDPTLMNEMMKENHQRVCEITVDMPVIGGIPISIPPLFSLITGRSGTAYLDSADLLSKYVSILLALYQSPDNTVTREDTRTMPEGSQCKEDVMEEYHQTVKLVEDQAKEFMEGKGDVTEENRYEYAREFESWTFLLLTCHEISIMRLLGEVEKEGPPTIPVYRIKDLTSRRENVVDSVLSEEDEHVSMSRCKIHDMNKNSRSLENAREMILHKLTNSPLDTERYVEDAEREDRAGKDLEEMAVVGQEQEELHSIPVAEEVLPSLRAMKSFRELFLYCDHDDDDEDEDEESEQ